VININLHEAIVKSIEKTSENFNKYPFDYTQNEREAQFYLCKELRENEEIKGKMNACRDEIVTGNKLKEICK